MRGLILGLFVLGVIGAGSTWSYLWLTRSPRALPQATAIEVVKSDRVLILKRDRAVIATYRVSLGAAPIGHKLKSGDERTPEGRYTLDWRNARSRYYKSLHVSYPSAADVRAARAAQVNPGGDIMIHGMMNGFGWAAPLLRWFDWTDGCIAVDNVAMEEIWRAVPVGTIITVRP